MKSRQHEPIAFTSIVWNGGVLIVVAQKTKQEDFNKILHEIAREKNVKSRDN